MKKMPIPSKPLYYLAALPFAVGLAVFIAFYFFLPGLPIIIFKTQFGFFTLLLGLLSSLIWSISLYLHFRSEQRLQKAVSEIEQSQDEAQRRLFKHLEHEVKNPLTAMRAALANLSETNGGNDRLNTIQDIQHQVDRLSRLVSNLRKLADIEERSIEKLPFDLGGLLEEVVETAQSNPAYSNHTIQLILPKVPWPLSPITGDRDLLGVAFYNLIENALKYTSAKDAIEIRAIEDGRSLIVEVADTGPGIPPDDLPRIFEELYRGTNARGIEGSGLGLALVERVISRHEGTISVRSRPGKGTVFTIRLPS